MSTTREIFDLIAAGWYNFRHRTIFPVELAEMASRWHEGKLLNIGCAHGPDFVPFRNDFELYGIDFSGEMLKLAQKYATKYNYYVNLMQADARSLPFPDNTFDYAIAIAAYHHLDDAEGRLRALRELFRILKPGGEAFITVWNRWQPRFWFTGKEAAVPWHTRNRTLSRYYYLFSYGELKKLVKEAGFTVLRIFPEHSYHFPVTLFSRNICLLVSKKH